jgi:hypothetical protein
LGKGLISYKHKTTVDTRDITLETEPLMYEMWVLVAVAIKTTVLYLKRVR